MRLLTPALWAVAIVIGLLSVTAHAQIDQPEQAATVYLTDDQETYLLGPHLKLLEDRTGQLTFAQIRSPQYAEAFVPNSMNIPSYGFTDSTVWVSFQIHNSSVEELVWWLEYRQPTNHYVTAYLPTADGSYRTVETGALRPFNTRDVPAGVFVFELTPAYESTQTVYLELSSGTALSAPLTLWLPGSFGQHYGRDMLLKGMVAGLLLVLVVYNLLIWLYLRDQAYLYYVLFVLCMLVFQVGWNGSGSQYLWPNQPWINLYVIPISGLSLGAFALMFAIHFLQTQRYVPRQHFVLQLILLTTLMIMVLTPFRPYGVTGRQTAFVLTTAFAALIVAGITSWLRGYKPARYYLLAWGGVLLSNVLLTTSLIGVLPRTAVTQQLNRPTPALLALLLPLAMADRINLIRQEREAARNLALRRAQENERLVQQHNVQLEAEVTERTRELAQTNRDLVVAKDNAEAAARAKSRFLATMSHELRTPLNAILGHVQLFRHETPTENTISIVEQSGHHLLGLIDDLIDLARVEDDKLALNPKPVDLNELLQTVTQMMRFRAEQKGLIFETLFAAELPVVVIVDQKRLRQIILNLIDNAVKFTSTGTVTFHVTSLARTAETASLRFSVRDRGIGIAEHELPNLTTLFYRTEHAEKHTEGTGLGLALTQRLLKLMESELHIESIVGRGTHCYFDLTVRLGADGAQFGRIEHTVSDPVDAIRIPPEHIFKQLDQLLQLGDIEAAEAVARQSSAEFPEFSERVVSSLHAFQLRNLRMWLNKLQAQQAV